MLTPDRRISTVNPAWETFTGFKALDVVGMECRPHGPTYQGDLAGLVASFYPPSEVMSGKLARVRTWIFGGNGERRHTQVNFLPLHDTTGAILAILAIACPYDQAGTELEPEQPSLREELLDLRARMYARYSNDALIGTGTEHSRILNGIAAAVGSKIPVTITGESGTGKRFVARLIHQRSSSRLMPLLGYDCQAIPPEILERELFGLTQPANSLSEWGRLVAPAGSTLVIGDILLMPRDLQQRLAVGLAQETPSARFIATTKGNLENAWQKNQIVAEFYHSLTALIINLRPLRDRIEEIPLLAQAFLERANLRGQVSRGTLSDDAIEMLQSYDWPGNLRELAKVIESSHSHSSTDCIQAGDLPSSIRGEVGGAHLPPSTPSLQVSLKEQLNAFEKERIEEALKAARHNKSKAAIRLGVNRPFLYRRIKELGIIDIEPSAGQADSSSEDEITLETG